MESKQNMTNKQYQGIKFLNQQTELVENYIATEEALQITINNNPFTITMRMPGDDEALIRGLLHAEDVLKKGYSPSITFSKNEITTTANLSIPKTFLGVGYLNSRTLLSVASCGICGKTELTKVLSQHSPLSRGKQVDRSLFPQLFSSMQEKQTVFKNTGGTHAAAIFTLEGELLTSKEDIGRHNAVDKAVGELLINTLLSQAKILTVSGRISYEIVIKCFKAGIPFLAAVSAPTSLAIDFAKELGITLLAFCREEKATCYSFPETIIS